MAKEYKIGRPIQWGAFSSTTRSIEAAKQFTSAADGVIFKITVRTQALAARTQALAGARARPRAERTHRAELVCRRCSLGATLTITASSRRRHRPGISLELIHFVDG